MPLNMIFEKIVRDDIGFVKSSPHGDEVTEERKGRVGVGNEGIHCRPVQPTTKVIEALRKVPTRTGMKF